MSIHRKRTRVTGGVETNGVWTAILACLILAALVGSHAWTRVEGTLAGYALSEAQAEQTDLLREQKSLQLELATRRAAVRIESDATRKLKMVEPSADRIIPLPAGPARQPALVQAEASR